MKKKVMKKIKKKYSLYKKILLTNDGMDYSRYIKARNECTREVKAAKRLFEKNIANNCKKDPKCFWKFVRNKFNTNSSVGTLLSQHDQLVTDDEDKANILNTFFSGVFTSESLSDLPSMESAVKSNGTSICDICITPLAVQDRLSKIEPNKAFGPDGISPRVLKELSTQLALPICILFNKSLESGVLPMDWKSAIITAIFKKGSKSDPNNYRPVSLTCVLCKLLESFVRDAIVNHMIDLSLYSECQHGFRKGRSCATQLLEVLEDCTKFMDEGNSFDIIYLDFKKAFDSVPHKRLLIKLESYGITGNVLKWVGSFLSNRIQKVKVKDAISDEAAVLSGIPQGSVLGPILFTIYINDLPDNVSSACKIFADDTKLYSTTDNHANLQIDINHLTEWSEKWQLLFNASKCKVVHYGHNNPKTVYNIVSNGIYVDIEECQEERDLGVLFDQQLKFDRHIQSAINKANKMLGIIKRSFSYLDSDMLIRLYKALVRPHLEYCNVIWSPLLKRQSVSIEKVQRRATKLITNIRDLNYGQRLAALGLPSLKFRRLRGDLIQCYKIINKIDDVDVNNFFHFLPHSLTRNSANKVFIKYSRTNIRKNVFSNRVAPFWNSLPDGVKFTDSINSFKNLLEHSNINCLKYTYD